MFLLPPSVIKDPPTVLIAILLDFISRLIHSVPVKLFYSTYLILNSFQRIGATAPEQAV